MTCWVLRNFDGLKRSCSRCPLVGTRSPEMSSSKLLGGSSGTAGSWRSWASSLLVVVVERPSPERRRRGQAWCSTLHANNELSCPPLQVFGRPWSWSWYVDSSGFSWDYLGHLSVSKPCPYLSVLQSYWNLNVWNRKEASFLSSVSRYLGLSIVFTSNLEYFAQLSSVGALMVSVVSARSNLLRLPRSSSGASRSLPLAGHYPSGNQELRRLLDRSENDNLWVL